MRQLSPLVAALVLLLCACSSDDGDTETPPADFTSSATSAPTAHAGCSPARTAEAGTTRRTLNVGGVERSFLLHIPAPYDGEAGAPLVVAFHGFAQTGEFMSGYTLFSEQADEEGFVVAYPDGLGSPTTWNSTEAIDQADDVAFAAALLDTLESELCIDTDAISLVGYSNGGGMAQRLACLMPERIAALGTVAATYVSCREAVPWIAFHGLSDPLVPYTGGENPPERGGGTFLDTRRTLSDWSRELGCDPLGQISRPVEGVEMTTFVNCLLGGGEVLLYSIIDGGHTWPGAYALPVEVVGATSQQISATEEIAEFFAARREPAAAPAEDDATAD
jgi:polyhydroxybutyrate depolymerase